MHAQPNNPLHGVKLEKIVNDLADHYGWQQLGKLIAINCFKNDPSVKSSLKFLRRTPWAKEQVENLYLDTFCTGDATPADPWANAMEKINKP
ncbi:VF530 family DNA-binding protein [Enterovibrio norvegicus]|uniref:VF530 family protein n=1 Tax=Enterovibrio norvegicus TaxID=188144 RepID=UPI000C8620B1|nr:VF530 family protein [Enterovibrio norvegicus]PMI32067.1 hypothetical protein BCU47_13610 [Enterovibrio norvegicus]